MNDDIPESSVNYGFEYQIYFRSDPLPSDTDLLRGFDLGNYQKSAYDTYHDDDHVVIADCGIWKVLAEGTIPSLEQMHSTRDNIERLAASHDIFKCSADDYDYELVFYESGEVRRKLITNSCWGSNQTIQHSGVPLPGELRLKNCGDDNYLPYLLNIAEQSGVNTRWENMRVYGPTNTDHADK